MNQIAPNKRFEADAQKTARRSSYSLALNDMTPKLEKLLQDIGGEVLANIGTDITNAALYAEGEDGVMSADIFYLPRKAKTWSFCFGSRTLIELLISFWEEWGKVPKQDSWRALTYSINNGKFRVDVTYQNRFNEEDSEGERRLSAVNAVFGDIGKVDYSQAKRTR